MVTKEADEMALLFTACRCKHPAQPTRKIPPSNSIHLEGEKERRQREWEEEEEEDRGNKRGREKGEEGGREGRRGREGALTHYCAYVYLFPC